MIPDLFHLKRTRRHLERNYRSTHSPLDFKFVRTATNKYPKLISLVKHIYIWNLILSSIFNPRILWKTINFLLHRNLLRFLPFTKSLSSLSQLFATYFPDKVSNLHINLLCTTFATPVHFLSKSIPQDFLTFASEWNIHSYLLMLKLLLRPRSYTYLTS